MMKDDRKGRREVSAGKQLHQVTNVKSDEGSKKIRDTRPHGNRDKLKDDSRENPATAQLNFIPLLCSLATVIKFRLGRLDMKGAYLQGVPINWNEILVRQTRGNAFSKGGIYGG